MHQARVILFLLIGLLPAFGATPIYETDFSRYWVKQVRRTNATFDGVIYAPNGINFTTSLTNRIVDATAQTNIWEDIVFSPESINPVGIVDAATLVADSGVNNDQLALEIAANKAFWVPAQMPHTWLAESTVYPHLHFEPQSDNAITNTWQISYAVSDIGSDFPASTVVTQSITIAAGSQWQHVLKNLPTNGISMSGKAGPSTIVRLKYVLLSTTEAMHLVSYDVHYRWGGSPVIYEPAPAPTPPAYLIAENGNSLATESGSLLTTET